MKEFKGGFIPKQQTGERNSPGENTNKELWQGESDWEKVCLTPVGTNDHQTKNNQTQKQKNRPPQGRKRKYKKKTSNVPKSSVQRLNGTTQ